MLREINISCCQAVGQSMAHRPTFYLSGCSCSFFILVMDLIKPYITDKYSYSWANNHTQTRKHMFNYHYLGSSCLTNVYQQDQPNRDTYLYSLTKYIKRCESEPCQTRVKELLWQFLALLDGRWLNNILLVLLQKLLIVCATVLRHKLRGLGSLRSKLVQPRRHLPTKKRPRHTEKQSFHQTSIWRTTYRSCTRYRRRPKDPNAHQRAQQSMSKTEHNFTESRPRGITRRVNP